MAAGLPRSLGLGLVHRRLIASIALSARAKNGEFARVRPIDGTTPGRTESAISRRQRGQELSDGRHVPSSTAADVKRAGWLSIWRCSSWLEWLTARILSG